MATAIQFVTRRPMERCWRGSPAASSSGPASGVPLSASPIVMRASPLTKPVEAAFESVSLWSVADRY
jgi:hypothetical protein